MVSALPSYAEASEIVAGFAAKTAREGRRAEQVPLRAAVGRILASAVRADHEMPSFPRSTRDGFACRAEEAVGHEWLTVAGSIRAGEPPAGPLPQGAAWEIMTGAAVPAGADAVVMLEHVEHEAGKIRLSGGRALGVGDNVVPQGAEAHSGDEIIAAGTRLAPQHIAAAATCGCATVEVFARPMVAILTTGDELVGVEAKPGPGQIRNSNGPMLAALVEEAGGEAWVLPTARDEEGAIEAALREAAGADLLLISGGVSAGKFDLVEPALAGLGAKFHFTGVRIQPGKPLVFGERPRAGGGVQPFFGLPGNPISSAATFRLFAAQVLGSLAGRASAAPEFQTARLERAVKGKPDLTRFVPSYWTAGTAEKEGAVAPIPWQGSGDLAAFARANCFLVVPEGAGQLAGGELVRILPI